MSNNVVLKKRNILNVVKTIKKRGPISKPDLARDMNMTAVSAHNFISELTGSGVLAERGTAESNGGRKAVLYDLNPSFGFIIGVTVHLAGLSISVYDISMNRLLSEEETFSADCGNDAPVDRFTAPIRRLIDTYSKKYRYCLGIGIVVPGQVNSQTGTVINLTNMPNWNNVPLKAVLEREFDVPLLVENDNKAVAISIKWFDNIREDASIVFVSVGSGVGAGILHNGQLFNGRHYVAGEIGHITIEFDGPACMCGNRGCLELTISDQAICGRLGASGKDIRHVIARGLAGNKKVMDAFRDASKYIGICIDHIVKSYDPEEIIIECTWLRAYPELFDHVVKQYFARNNWLKPDQLIIRLNHKQDIFLLAPAAMVFEELFTFKENSRVFTNA